MTGTIKLTASENSNRWKRRITMERRWMVIAVSVLLRVGSAMNIDAVESGSRSWITASTSAPKSLGGRPPANSVPTVATQAVDQDICYSPGCIETASSVMKNMNASVDPCDDFYQFACGGFLNSTIIPADGTEVDLFTIIEDKLKEQLRASFESDSKPEEPKHFKLVKSLYKLCMNETAIEKRGSEPLQNLLKKLGGWPVLVGAQWNENSFDWITMMAKFRDAGDISPFIAVRVNSNPKNSTRRIIELDQPAIDLDRAYMVKGFDDRVVQAYYRYMVDVAVILGADKDLAEMDLKKSLLFAIKLANISVPNEERRNISQLFNPMTLKELTEKYASVPWKEYLTNVMPRSISIEDDEIVNVIVPSYVSDLEQLMSSTPKRVQANHAMWLATTTLIRLLNDELRKRELEFWKVVDGTSELRPKWEDCVREISYAFRLSIGAMFVKKYFDPQAKRDAVEMVADIRKQFVEMLEQIEWMDENTRQKALEKANAMTSYIAYPDELLDDRKLEPLHEKYELSEDNYFENILNIDRLRNEDMFDKLRKPVNKSEWFNHESAAIVNAYYHFEENYITFPAGILQGAFFRYDRPRYMNYGAIGSIIGHEIIHGFDDVGRQYNENGELVDWWEPSTDIEYARRKQCIIDQYGNYTIEANGQTYNLNGIKTQGDNIADNGGTKLAYFAYSNWAKRNKPEQRLPGLNNYTPHQMYWISLANPWCSKARPDYLKHAITTDSHSPSEFRVLGPLSNTPKFAEDFKCPIGSKMNPVKKCSVW